MEGQTPEQTGSPTWLPPQLERRPTFKSLSPGNGRSVYQSLMIFKFRFLNSSDKKDPISVIMAALVRPSFRVPPSSNKAASLLPPLVVGALLLGLALMTGNQTSDVPASLTIEASDLQTLTRDNADLQDYPSWSKTIDDINAAKPVHHGLWAYYKGPPFLQRVTMYSGNDIDLTKGGELVRRIVGLPLNYGKWEGNHYIADFETQQMYFLQSNQHSVLLFPPMKEENLPILSDHAKNMIHRYVSIGHNTLIVLGGPGALEFINKNLFADGATHKLQIPTFSTAH